MEYFPFFMRLSDQEILVVGGGDTALRKAKLLAKANCSLTVLAPDIVDELSELKSERLILVHEHYQPHYLENKFAVIAATNDNRVNAQIAADAEQRKVLVNVVDQPSYCRFIFPSIIDRDPLVVALSSAGQAPVLLRQLRTQLEALVPQHLGKLARFAGRFRDYVKKQIKGVDARRRFWESVFTHPLVETVYRGDDTAAELELKQLAENFSQRRGQVYLIGAGPGDPDLLTFKALRLMQSADVVLYDRLVSSSVLELVRRDADLISVGKQAKKHTIPQGEINQLLIQQAKAGKVVARLKGGDPFIFGRGGEEVFELLDSGVSVEVVPGITSASGASCYCGIPLTHRDYAQSVLFATGHLKSGELDLAWSQLAKAGQTLVIYMGLNNLRDIMAQLQHHGLPSDTPVAVISSATRDNQQVVIAALNTIAEATVKQQIVSPALIIVGQVVSLHQEYEVLRKKNELQQPSDKIKLS